MHLVIGTGKVGRPLSELFNELNVPALSTTRSGKVPTPLTGVAFDWNDPSTFQNPFTYAEAKSNVIQSIFMTPPPAYDMLSAMKPFIDIAVEKGVKRFVLLSSTLVPPGPVGHGTVHRYLAGLGVEYVSIRPSWFFANFIPSNGRVDLASRTVTSATGSSKTGFVDPRDIADCAYHAMTDKVPLNGSYYVFGPELLSYREVATSLSSVAGKTFTHRDLSTSEFRQMVEEVMKLPTVYAEMLARFEDALKSGAEEKLFRKEFEVEEIQEKREIWFGKRRLHDYFEENKDIFTN
ncbi:hypothetical protein BDP27DRAFT_1349935 [Rhodocollybia butyracea]|uniref:Agroclavine dehydrogenase n=1 Tax=Rhodocollybia butyracea TaxID=206335 RepID=A0A9P5P6I3_9AGAR|nr:hypothetical protein BDP27DRAFT_1349935 [Rhodocollybia butyracea]